MLALLVRRRACLQVSNVITQPAKLGNWGTSYNKLGVPAYNRVGPTGVVYLIIFVFVLLGAAPSASLHHVLRGRRGWWVRAV